jgi:hypothetical protein
MDPLIRCPRCWKHVSEPARFCPRCGSALKGGNAVAIPRQADPPPQAPERDGSGATALLLFLLLSALGTAGMLLFGLTTHGPIVVTPAPAQPQLAPPAWSIPDRDSADSSPDPYRSEQVNPPASFPDQSAQPPVYRFYPRTVHRQPPVPSEPPHDWRHRHEQRDDGWGR